MNDPTLTQAQRIVALEEQVERMQEMLLRYEDRFEVLQDAIINFNERIGQLEWESGNA